MIKEIEHINHAIYKSLKNGKKEANAQGFCLAESITIRGDEDVTFPAIVLPSGECRSVFGEVDKHDVTFYHRLGGISFQEDTKASFGSGSGYVETDSLSLIVYGKRAAISPYRMEQIARQAIATTKNCSVAESDFNSLQVYASEYMGVKYFLTPAYFLFKINYRITSTYNPGCANIE